jgi:hypothetical protein
MVAMGAPTPDDPLLRGREALAGGDWDSARSYFEQARELGETAEVLVLGLMQQIGAVPEMAQS